MKGITGFNKSNTLLNRVRTIVFGVLALSPLAASAQTDASMSFDIDISLSTQALTTINETGENLTMLVTYYGDPSPAGKKYVNDIGTVELVSKTIELNVPGEPIHVSGHDITQSRLAWINDSVKVNVNLYSSRKASDDNILDCDFIDDELKNVVSASPVPMHCSLISENRQSNAKP
ncbi:hypothetical protein [Advenella sp. S44]|uniref:hypothetical protein n=1 Tax=Advenella sp. S44 TaxID=1982755 RepID=UPI001290165C|nr:hypothetical protein [Advenella sp. S44]